MFVVYVLSEVGSWDYFRTIKYSCELGYELFDLNETFDHTLDQYPILMHLIMYKKYIGKNLRIYYLDDEYNDWS